MSARFRWTLTNLGDSTSEVLTRDPKGWEEMSLRLTRDKLYHGVFTEVSTSLKWHCNGGGKDFIDSVYNTEDVNGIIEVLIEIDCDSSGTYTELYTGRLDLATYSTDGEYTTAQLERSDLYSKLKARDEISVNLETTTSIGEETITAPGTVQLAMHSQLIFLKSSASDLESRTFDHDYSLVNPPAVATKGFVSPGITTRVSEAENFLGIYEYSDVAINGPTASTTIMPAIFEATDDDVDYPDTYTYRLRLRGTFTDNVDAVLNRSNFAHSIVIAWGPTLAEALSLSQFNTLYNDDYNTSLISFSQTFDTGDVVGTLTLNYADKVWLYWYENEEALVGPYSGSLQHIYQYDEMRISLEINSTTSASTTKGLLVHEAFNQVSDAIADQDVSFYSDFYGRVNSDKTSYNEDGCGSNIVVTNGLNIRSFDDKNIYCSLRDLFISFNAIHNIGLGIERYDGVYTPEQDTIRVEKLEYFYDNTTQSLQLTRPVKVEIIADNSRFINNINIGYDKWETEFSGGLDEPCTRHEYSTKVNAVKGQYLKLSKYIASGYAIESTRRKSLAESEDWRYDNDNFIIAVKNGVSVEFFAGNSIVILNADAFTDIDVGDICFFTGSSSNDGINFVVTSVQNIYTDHAPIVFYYTVVTFNASQQITYEPKSFLVSFTYDGTTMSGTEIVFVPFGGGAIAFDSEIDGIDAGDIITVSNTVSNDGVKNVLEEADLFTQFEGPQETVIVISNSTTNEVAPNAIIEAGDVKFYSTELYADSFSSGTGMASLDTAYNLRLTPARMLLAHLNAITACLQKIVGLISFVKGEGNTQLALAKDDVGCQEDYSGEILSESQSFAYNDTDAANITPLWLPEIYKFEYPITSAQLGLVRANPHGYIEVTDDHGNVRKGFILDFDYTLKSGLTKFELLKMYE